MGRRFEPVTGYQISKEILWTGVSFNIRFRIAIINDFRNTYACVDYKKFGEDVMILDAWLLSPAHRGYNLRDDDIGIFLNYEQKLRTKSKQEALEFVDKLIEGSPPEARRELNLHKDYLARAL